MLLFPALILGACLNWPGAVCPVDEAEPSPERLEAEELVIGRIEIRTGDIFDPDEPGENRRFYRLANRVHRNTRRSAIEHALLFHSGDRYDARTIAESERALRSEKYLYDAKIHAVRGEDGTVDLLVETRDVWTLSGGVSFGRKGGVNRTKFGLEDTNFLGFGKSLAVKRTSSVDRTANEFRYFDGHVLSTRMRLGLEHSSNSDGQRSEVDFGRPFFALDTRWAAGAHWLDDDREETRYDLGQVTDRFRHRERALSLFGGWSNGRIGERTARWRAGFTFEEDRFEPLVGDVPGGVLPEDRTLAYPWVEFSSIQDRFEVLHDLDRIFRSEDLNFGREMSLRLGWSTPAFGGDRSRLIYDATLQQGLRPGADQLLFLSGGISGRAAAGVAEDLRATAEARYYWRDWDDHVLFVGLRGELGRRLDRDNQLLLGGDNGLRGYPLRYAEGERAVLLTVEQRFYTDWHPWRLFRVGAAVFTDIGVTRDTAGGSRILRDIGLGLRLGSSRSSSGSLLHLDLAFPLDGSSDISRLQFLVGSKETF